MDLKFGNDIDLTKNAQIENVILQVVSSIAEANDILTSNGQMCYVNGDGIYINETGTVVKVGDELGTADVIFSTSTPAGTVFTTGALWFNPNNSVLSVWTGTAWISTDISGILNWESNVAFAAGTVVYYNNNLYRNNSGVTINTITFNETLWQNLTGSTIKTYTLLRTQVNNTTVDAITLSNFKEFVIAHNMNNAMPNVVIKSATTGERVYAGIAYIDVNHIKITFSLSLISINDDFNISLS